MRVEFITSEGADNALQSLNHQLLNNLKTYVKGNEVLILPRGIIYDRIDDQVVEVFTSIHIKGERLVVSISGTITEQFDMDAEILDVYQLIAILKNVEQDQFELLPEGIQFRLTTLKQTLGDNDPYFLDKLDFCLDIYVKYKAREFWGRVSRMQALRVATIESTLIQREYLGEEKALALSAVIDAAKESI